VDPSINDPPCSPEFAHIIFGVRKNLSASVRQSGSEAIAEAIHVRGLPLNHECLASVLVARLGRLLRAASVAPRSSAAPIMAKNPTPRRRRRPA